MDEESLLGVGTREEVVRLFALLSGDEGESEGFGPGAWARVEAEAEGGIEDDEIVDDTVACTISAVLDSKCSRGVRVERACIVKFEIMSAMFDGDDEMG